MNRAAENPAPRESGRLKRRQLRVRCTLDGAERRQRERLRSHHFELRYWRRFGCSIRSIAGWQQQWTSRIQSSRKSAAMFDPIAGG